MKKSQKSNTNLPQRRMFLETLEDRRLLAGVPELAGIQTNNGDLLSEGDVLNVAPQEIVLNFNQDAEIDPASLSSVTILRSGGDGDFNVASAASHFGTGGVVNIAFAAQAGGTAGNDIEVVVSKSDHNNASGPIIVVDVDGTTVRVDLNTNAGNETTAKSFVDAINNDQAASGLIRVSLLEGDGVTDITAAATDYSPITLSGSNDEVIEAGYIGVDESARQVVFRFREALTDEVYQVSVRGTGASALSDLDGSVFLDGEGDFTRNFRLDLGPQIEAVVPQPVVRDPALGLQQHKDTIHVYFNEDNLDPSLAVDPGYYPLIFTNDTVENTDDIVFLPTEVTYSPGSDLVVLKYASDLDELANAGAGTFRLRIGAKEYQDNNSLPFTPLQLNLSLIGDAATSYDTATAIGKTMSVSGDGIAAADGTGFTITDVDNGTTPFEFDGGVILQIPDGSLIADVDNFEIGDGAQNVIFEFDSNSSVATGNIAIAYTGAETAEEMADLVATVLTSTGLIVESNVLSSGEIHLGWNQELSVDLASANGLQQEGNTTIVDAGARRVLVINRTSFNASNVADAISSSINAAGNSQLRASRVGTLAGDSRIALVGVDTVTASPVFNVAIFESLLVQGTIGDDGFDPRTAIANPGAEDEPGHRDIRVQDHLLVDGAYLTVPVGGFQDGDIIEVTNGLRSSVFEFDNDDTLSNFFNIPIVFLGTETPEQFAGLLADVLTDLGAVYNATTQDGGVISVLLVEGYYVDGLDTELVVEEAPAARGGVTTLDYSFPAQYGTDPLGNTLLNAITENQKQRAREIFEMYGQALGISFVETDVSGLQIVTGDMRALDPTLPIGPGGVLGVARFGGDSGLAIMDLQDFQNTEDDEYGGPWFNTAIHEIGHLLGLGHTDGLAPFTVMNSDINLGFGQTIESRFPGDHDVSHGQYLYGVRTGDLDLYEIDITEAGTLDVETFAERLADVSLLDTAVSVFRDVLTTDANGTTIVAGKELVARNDDYFSEDSKLTIDVTQGHYYIGVSSTGNNSYDPVVEGTGQGGKTQGDYELRLVFSKTADDFITDTSGVDLDADGDGTPGGTLNTWFNVTATDDITVGAESRTIFVDKLTTTTGNGSISSPYANLNTAMTAASAGDIVRVVGNAGADGDAATLQDNQAYELGYNPLSGADLPDGDSLVVKQGVTLMVDAGVVIKSRRARIARGSDSSLIDLSDGAIQMLGTPRLLDINGNLLTDANGDSVPGEIYLTSLFDKEIGLHTTPEADLFDPVGGDWGGIDINNRFDAASTNKGDFVDLINHTTIQYGGGLVVVEGNVQVVSPIHLTNARPTITNNTIQFNADSAISANPDSFEESRFNATQVSDYDRVGPEIHGNTIIDNSINGIFVRIKTEASGSLESVTDAIRFDDRDIVHVLTENLIIDAGYGGPKVQGVDDNGDRILESRYDGSLVVDPGMVVKLHGSRIELPSSSNLIIEGTVEHQIVITALGDSRYGAGGTYATDGQSDESPIDCGAPVFVNACPGDWGGITAGQQSDLSIDYSTIAFAGGTSRVPGAFEAQSPLSVLEGSARIARSTLEWNAANPTEDNLDGSLIYASGAESLVIVDNTIQHNLGPAISVSVNDLNHVFLQDWGRQTGTASPVDGGVGNQGPLIQGNMLDDNSLNGMIVRGGTLTTEGVWDDTDIVHVVINSIHVPDFHTYGGLRLESSPRESLVVKLVDLDASNPAGFTADGKPLDIDDRIGGTINIVGQPHYPVVMTSIADDTVGAGYTPSGQLQTDTANDSVDIGGGGPTTPTNTEIVVNLGSGIAAGSTLALRVDDAVTLLEGILRDPISLSLDMDTGALPQGVIGGMASTTSIGELQYDAVRSAMVADGSTNEQALLNQLPTFAQLNVTGGTAQDTVYISQANAKALESLDINGATFNRSGNCWTACDGYFIVSDQFDPAQPGTISLIAHEILHSLGFISSLNRTVGFLSPLDMFRIAPGTGATDFTNAARVLNQGPDTVFYNGIFDPVGITGVTGLQLGDIPMSTGTGGDGNQPSHFKFRQLTGDVYLGLMGPVLNPTPEANGEAIVRPNDISVLGLIGWDVDTATGGGGGISATPNPGDWDGINLLQYSNDRNLAVINERESDDHGQPIYENFDAASSQFVGQLAANQFAGDELSRLGFEIQGTIETPTDQDIYRFEAVAGTEIWLDIDRTEVQLDTVVELLDSAGRVLYRSDNSGDTSAAQTNPNNDSSLVLTTEAQPMGKSVFGVFDNGTTNVKDAGMRLLLPGALGQVNTYHVRVLSADQLVGGSYQLQIRLQELDEEPGSSIQFADIRYATAGVEIVGLPVHSPLAGEVGEDQTNNNDTAAGAQSLGNLLQTDRSVVSVAGSLSASGDVDFYTFDVSYEDVQTQGTGMAAIFDLDYADGLARANTNISIFDAAGNLILVGSDSNIADDRPAPLQDTDLDDLSRGTVGPLDPFVGTVELPVGTYTIAVSNETVIPTEMSQFYDANAVNPLLRLEPINSINRVVEERFDGTALFVDNDSLVPYFLGDVVLFVSADAGFETTSISTVDGFTGQVETTVSAGIGIDVQDVAMRPDGFMFGFTVDEEDGNPSDAEAGNYLQISTGDGTIMNLDAAGLAPDDGVFTFEDDGTGADTLSDHGIHYDATVFGNLQGDLQGFVVGHRPDNAVFLPGTTPFPSQRRNLLYRFDPNTGTADSLPEANRQALDTLQGAATQIVERGILDTAGGPVGLADKLLLAAEATIVDVVNDVTTSQITDGLQFHIDDDNVGGTPSIEFEFNSGPEIYFDMDPDNGIFLRDGDTFNLDSIVFEFNTGPVFVVDAADGSEITDGETFTFTDNNGVLRIFEFDNNDTVSGGNEVVTVSNTTPQSQIVTAMVAAINATTGFNAEASVLAAASNRITLINDSILTTPSENSDGLSITGDHALVGVGQGINIEENDTDALFGQNMVSAFASISSIELGLDGHRINFLGANTGSFTTGINRGAFVNQNSNGTTGVDSNGANRISVPFLAQETNVDIALRIITALSQTGIPAIQNGSIVELTGTGVIDIAQTPLRIGGTAPGGDITGMAFIGNTLYAVSDAGGFYTIDNPMTSNASASYISSSAADLQGINFQGLSAGPTTTEDGRYANTLFGVDGNGRIFAFDTSGTLQPVFVDGTTSIATGITNANGIDFSTLIENPWSLSPGNDRALDSGHGRQDSYDGTQLAEIGGSSLHFGTGINPLANLPGGAHGSVETNEFSLQGYSKDDNPTLYFNYFLDTEGAQGVRFDPIVPNEDMMDSFRVFAADESGEWVLLSTNNSFDNNLSDSDEIDMDPPNAEMQVQDTFDNTGGWRQARVDLSSFAGSEHLKLRFDFSSAGDTNTGDLLTTGTELRIGTPADLRDGDVFTVDDTDFEIDLGFTLVAPTGAALTDGETLTLDYGFGVSAALVVRVDENPTTVAGVNEILVRESMTAAEVAQSVETAINENLPRQTVVGVLGGSAETNDILLDATTINLNGLSGTFAVTQAEIGDNSTLVGNMNWDVDILKVSVTDGTTIRVNTNTDPYGNQLNSIVRLFDSNGIQVAISDNDPGPGELPGTDSYLEVTVTADGDYFIGVSGFGNGVYDPTDMSTRLGGSIGRYDLQIDIDIAAGFTQRQNNRVNLPNAVSLTNNSLLITEGSVGVGSDVAVPIHSGMTGVEVASRIRVALADTFAGGELGAFKQYGSVIRMIGHTVDDRGPLGLTETMPGDEYGNFESNRRGQDSTAGQTQLSSFEGIYIDDIIIGFAERGEMVTGANANDAFVPNLRSRLNQITTGEYQLELRQGTQHVDYALDGTLPFVARTWDTNDRLGNELAIDAPAGFDIVEGATFTISDGYPHNEVTFEFDDIKINDGVAGDNVQISIDPSSTEEEIGLLIRDAINSNLILAGADIVAGFASGANPTVTPTDNIVNLYGPVVVDIDDPLTVPYSDTGDDNAPREQGQVIIGQNVISHSLEFGISMVSSTIDADGNPHQGPVRVGRELNTLNLLPGVVVTDNLLTDNALGGISLSGDVTAGQTAPVPFARIINNTIVGNGTGTGIQISNNASPTLLNNIVADLNIGIDVDASSSTTVIGGMLYANNTNSATDTKGDFSIDIDTLAGDPLFQDAANGNYYLASGALAIDSAVESLEERPDLERIKTPLGLSLSPILVSGRDLLGNLRVDDPTVPTPTGIGHNVFADRGAIDRADFIGPQAVIISPLDNTAPDRDPADTIIELRNQDLEVIAIQLVESENSRDLNGGSGVLDSSVQSSAVTLFKDGVRLEPRFDYTFEYDSANDIIRLLPLAGKFSVDSTYRVELTSARGIVIQTQTGDLINDGEMFTINDEVGNSAIFEFDSGYSMRVPAAYTLTVPELGGSAIEDGEFFTITSSAGSQVFEFDRDGAVQLNAVVVSYTVADDADEVAQSISDALDVADINLSPHPRGDGEVHVGSSGEHTLSSPNTIVTQRGVAASVLDGEYVTVDNGNAFLQMEFDTDSTTLAETTKVISITPGLDNEQIASAIVNAINQAALSLSPTHVADGVIHVGGDRLTVLDSSNSSVGQFGEPGTRTELGLRVPSRAGVPFDLVDGEVFTISDGTTTVTFELDNDATTTAGNRAITFSDTSTLDQISNSIVSQVQLSGLGLTASNLGDGFVELAGSTLQHSITMGTSGLTQIGLPGVEATVAVNYLPFESFNEQEMAVAIADVINAKSTLEGVTAIARTDSVFVSGADSVTGILISLVSGIEDRAGNPLYPNRDGGDTTFEINLTSALDWGDAPNNVEKIDPVTAVVDFRDYPTTEAQNGARHLVVDGFSLGAKVDTEPDGQPAPLYSSGALGDGDDEDGLANYEVLKETIFQAGQIYPLVVVVNGIGPDRTGVVDAWMDFNNDISWDGYEAQDPDSDPGVTVPVSEKLKWVDQVTGLPLENVVLVPGDNELFFKVPLPDFARPEYDPNNINPGRRCPALRIRLSSKGVSSPMGFASDGEVEDYQFFADSTDWHNRAISLDVNKDSFVTPIDALLVINYLNENFGNGTGELPPRSAADAGTPPLVDVNDDGFVTSIDALRVINYINKPSGEGEAEGEAEEALMIHYGVTQVSVTAASIADLVEPVASSVVVDIPIMASPERVREAQFAELDLGRESSLDAVLEDIGGEVSDLRDIEDGHDEFFASVQY
jgi:hypothetical protein